MSRAAKTVFAAIVILLLIPTSAHAMSSGAVRVAQLYAAESVPNKQVLTVINQAGVSPQLLGRVEAAAIIEVNLYVRQVYPSAVPITFGDGGWPITITDSATVNAACKAVYAGCHTYGDTPTLWVADNPLWSEPYAWQYIFSHEVIETSVDPLGGGPEVCDTVAWHSLTIGTVPVAAFVGGPPGTLMGSNAASVPHERHKPTRDTRLF